MERRNHKELEGVVVSQKMKKTVIVAVKRKFPHPIFKKYILKIKKYYVHDENQKAAVGDVIRLVESRPISKLKKWRLKEIIKRAVN